MNTQLAFAFGMLAMVAITMLVVIVVGMVKVIRLGNKLENLEQVLGREVEMIHRHSSDVERNMYSEINDTRKNTDSRFDKMEECFNSETNDIRRNMDSRFDKYEKKIVTAAVDLINLQNNTEEVIKNKKQLLKD